jgi:hypothetical protein
VSDTVGLSAIAMGSFISGFTLGADMGAGLAAADSVVFGWGCCHATDRMAEGCVMGRRP